MIQITPKQIKPEPLRRLLEDSSCGGFCVFEGRMRRQNEGRMVRKLEYESYVPMAESQIAGLVKEAKKRWGIRKAVAVHRVGRVDLGGLAVWVGVASPHRAEAFAACRFLIDGIKHQVAIWKLETYTDGSKAWVGCGIRH
jgi:molybdopterin synthase catalytic subunit